MAEESLPNLGQISYIHILYLILTQYPKFSLVKYGNRIDVTQQPGCSFGSSTKMGSVPATPSESEVPNGSLSYSAILKNYKQYHRYHYISERKIFCNSQQQNSIYEVIPIILLIVIINVIPIYFQLSKFCDISVFSGSFCIYSQISCWS